MTSAEEFAALARAHLPQSLADRWISLLRPAIEFSYPTEPVDPGSVALRTGGDPWLPDDVPWPKVEGYGPLIFTADMDCAAVAAAGGVESLPTKGHLLFFFGGHPDRYPERWMGRDSRRWTAWEQGRVIYVPPGVERKPRRSPEEPDPDEWLDPIERLECGARLVSTPPPSVVFELCDDDFESAVNDGRDYRYTGGYPNPCQGPVELEAAAAALGDGIETTDARVIEEAGHWRLLYQEAWDAADMVVYWMIREDDLAARRFDRVWFGQQG